MPGTESWKYAGEEWMQGQAQPPTFSPPALPRSPDFHLRLGQEQQSNAAGKWCIWP